MLRRKKSSEERGSPFFTLPLDKFLGFPWRLIAALALALAAQTLLEPAPHGWFALPLYLAAIGLATWSFANGEWTLASRADEPAGIPSHKVRLLPLLGSLILLGAAFYFFGGNRFTPINLSLWLAGMTLLVFSVWTKRPAPRADLKWIPLFIAVLVLSAFFRFHRLGEVPAEPFSDHAEKILDVYDITQGETRIFFPRNTGREGLQMYWTVLTAWVFRTGLSFQSLKIGTVLLGLFSLPFIYLLGNEIGNRRVGLLAMTLAGMSYWLNLISRIGLRFPLYPLFASATLFYLLRGLRTGSRNDFILCGLLLGLGLHGYSPFRIMPFVILAAFLIYVLHEQAKEAWQKSIGWLALVSLTSLAVFLPLLRYALDNPELFSFRAFSRVGNVETSIQGSALQIFLDNLLRGLLMFNLDNGGIWVNSVTHRPALDVVTGALFVLGIVLLTARYARENHWRDLILLVSIPILLMPSVLSLAFPEENPALNRAGGAAVVAALVSGLALEGAAAGLRRRPERPVEGSGRMRWLLIGILLAASAYQNHDLVFRQFDLNFQKGAWNTSEMGEVIGEFRASYGQADTVWIVPFPQWVDTRLPAMWIGIPNRDFAIRREDLASTLQLPAPKLFIAKANVSHPEYNDSAAMLELERLYPQGEVKLHSNGLPWQNFWIFLVPETP